MTPKQKADCEAHWAEIREKLPRHEYPPPRFVLEMEFTKNEAVDVARFKGWRKECLIKRSQMKN
jgi:hypothetical protein